MSVSGELENSFSGILLQWFESLLGVSNPAIDWKSGPAVSLLAAGERGKLSLFPCFVSLVYSTDSGSSLVLTYCRVLICSK